MMPTSDATASHEQPAADSARVASADQGPLCAREIFRRNLVILTQRAGISQTKLAEMTGLYQTQLSTVFRGLLSVRIDTAEKIASALGVSLSAMFIAPSERDYEVLVQARQPRHRAKKTLAV
jgi:transcriptional regulator with XRE-family HTH domain